MANIPKTLRQQVLERGQKRCEYCQTAKKIVTVIEIDHIVPISAGGLTTLNNLCVACHNCNNTKLDYQTGIDPENGQEYPLFNPRIHQWAEHFRWSEDYILVIGLTPIGRATVERLDMNADDVVESREIWVGAGLHPPR